MAYVDKSTAPRFFHAFLLIALLALGCGGIAAYKLRWSVTPGFMFQEAYGLAYNHAPDIGSLCSPDPRAGLESTSNVTDQRSSSYFYALLNKTVFSGKDLYTAHRMVGIVLYGAALLIFGLAALLSGVRQWIAAFYILFFAFNPQLLALLFESKLTLLSVFWLAGVFAAAACENRLKTAPTRAVFCFFLPFLLAFSYDTYAVARPMAVAFVAFFYGLLTLRWFSNKRRDILFFMVGCFAAWQFLVYLHPAIRFDLSLFEGRTESIVNMNGHVDESAPQQIRERLGEMKNLFNWSQTYFEAETTKEMGCAELLITCGLLALLVAAGALKSGNGRTALRGFLRNHALVLLLLGGCLIVSLIIPLCSTTYVRGHRLFGFYSALIFLNFILWEICQRIYTGRVGRYLCLILGLLVISDTGRRLHEVYNWMPPERFTRPMIAELINTIENIDASRFNLGELPDAYHGYFCDASDRPIWEHDWNAAMYVTGTGCAFKLRDLHEYCPCDEENSDLLKPIICFTRYGKADEGYTIRVTGLGVREEKPMVYYSSREHPSKIEFVNVQRERNF